MKKFIYAAMGLATFAVVATSCKKDLDKGLEKPYIPVTGAVLDTLVGDITGNVTVTENTYLRGLVYVKPGAILTINPGVTIYGSINRNGGAFDSVNLANNKGTLCVERGAKLIAAGTSTQPIIWTSDNSIPVGSRAAGDWGGVVLYGNAKIHKANGATSGRYEAFDIVPNDQRNFYGGTDSLDNSGTITYNRFEFAGGVVTQPNKEVNALTFCGVGQGTIIRHVEVLKSGDDAFEFFGGSVDLKYALAYATKDDDFDFDEGYSGRLQFIVAVRDTSADNSGSEMIEADNDASVSNFGPYTQPFIANATLLGPAVNKTSAASPNSYFVGAAHIRRRVSLRLVNSYVLGNGLNYGLVFTPSTGAAGTINGGPIADLLDPPALTLPGNVQYNNYFQINRPGFDGVAVRAAVEGNPPTTLTNDASIVAKLISAANINNGVVGVSDMNLGAFLENTGATPSLTGGVDLTSLGTPFFTGFFTATNERGGNLSGTFNPATGLGNWIEADFLSGLLSVATN